MATALDRIIDYKRGEVADLKRQRSMGELDAAARSAPPPRGFAAALTKVASTGENALICELKRKSPSAGEILPGAVPAEIAAEYERGGAACLSILTDGPSFGGALSDLEAVREATRLPLLRKDFMLDPIQIAEARAHGADAILVILSAVDDGLAGELIAAASDYRMDALVEVHDRGELDRALALPSKLIGINNRDLKRMETRLDITESLAGDVGNGIDLVSESGIHTEDDIIRLRATGVRRFLIGESLMKSKDRAASCKGLKSAGKIDAGQERI